MLAFLFRLLRSVALMFRPPFDGLWVAILLYYFWCFLVHPQQQIARGNLPDPDDYMYLDQVLDWLKGQGWYDDIQHRLDPPGGGFIHFSRLAMIPMAALTWLFEAMGVPPRGAATLMAMFEPLLLFAGFFVTIRWVAESFVPKNWAGVTAYVTLFTTGVLSMFEPGHVDHHGLIVLLVALALGCAVRMLQKPEDARWGLATGFILALALTIALETLPWIIVMSGWLGLWAVIKGGKPARSGLGYGLSLYLSSIGFLLITRPPHDLLIQDVAAYSIVYVYFTGSIAVIFAAIALAGYRHVAWRWVLAVGTSAVTGVMFLSHFPDLSSGPWGGVDPVLAHLILDNVSEAASIITLKGGSILRITVAVLSAVIALGASGYFSKKARPKEFWPMSLIALLLLTAFLLSVFYQFRFVGMLGLLSIVPLTMVLQRGWEWIGTHESGRRKVLAEIGLLLLIGPLPAVLMPAIVDGRSFNTGVLLFPVHVGPEKLCDMYGLEKVLRSPQLYGGKPRVIMNTMGLGPELLFRTPDFVISAPYHEDVAGNLDSVRFFSATDPAKAEAVARRRHVDLVIACALVPGMYTNLGAVHRALPDAISPTDPSVGPQPPMILRLITGQHLPNWLLRVQSPALRNYVVYEIAPRARRSRESE